MRTVTAIRDVLGAEPHLGLTSEQVSRSRTQFGSNRLTPLPREPIWKKFLEKFDEPIIKILLAASLLKILVDLFQSVGMGAGFGVLVGVVATVVVGLIVPRLRAWLPSILFGLALILVIASALAGHPSYDGLAVMLAVILATGVAFAAEYRSDREFEVLNAGKDAALLKVTRDGHVRTVPLDEIVVGDLVTLEMGDEVPADGRVLKATEFYIDQSLLTGESEPVHKSSRPLDDASSGPEQPGCVYRGTQVVDGVAQVVIVEVGDTTMLGQIAARLAHDAGAEVLEGDQAELSDADRVQRKLSVSKELTPLQLKLQQLARQISRVGYAAAVAIFVALVVKGIWDGVIHWPANFEDFTHVVRKLLDFFVIMVIVIVVAVPEGLPMSVTVSLALAMQKMTRANSLVRQLVACETIGSATVICSDKTGTLTQNRMRVDLVAAGDQVRDRAASDWAETLRPVALASPRRPADWMALIAAVNSTAHLEEKDGASQPIGNATEGALLSWLKENGLDYAQLRRDLPVISQVHFSSERKRMTTVVRIGDRLVALVKGATEFLLEGSARVLDADGAVHPWTESTRARVRAQVAGAAGRAMRTLAMGYAVLPATLEADEESLHAVRDQLEQDMVFVGFVAIRDPLRDDVRDAVRECRAAGIEVKMITGDNPETARAIAAEVELLDRPDAEVLTTTEFNALSNDQVLERMPRLRVLARARPLDKLRLVQLLQQRNEVVAMTGDGTNDAPSLKRADVGLSMGIAGTEVAKEASKIVLLDDSFATIVKAVHWGRALYENIQRFVQFQLTINVSALVIAFLAPFLRFGEPPFTVLQFLWINIIMDTAAAIALCSEPPRAGLMRAPPKRRDESILTPLMLRTILFTALFFIVVMCVLLVGMEGTMAAPGWWAGPHATTESSVWSPEFPLFTTRQATLFFTIYVMFQVWNLINCRSLDPEVSGWRGLSRNRTFLCVALLIVLGQFLIVTYGGSVFKVEPLRAVDWLMIALGTSSVILFAEGLRGWQRRSRRTTSASEVVHVSRM